ncbi:hypothetical protein FIBSPDRAFT_1050208 [Athelia psychrophila]|uniref:DUF7402 domain-containing protein n=1 Tax=Athelia psychrophila TaxID=1759441 RepID=A0A166B122_9AGAM|nr:hypothetical protein FIBSPDRAFT_1050208 [Fibularhizoctonia sp. CBS 109695]
MHHGACKIKLRKTLIAVVRLSGQTFHAPLSPLLRSTAFNLRTSPTTCAGGLRKTMAQVIQAPGNLNNFAFTAVPTASSSGMYNGVQTSAHDVNDGTMAPWVSQGGAGQWLLLTFPTRIQMNMIYLYDRGNVNDQIASGMLKFDDGTALSVGALNNDGSATPISFPTLLSSTILFEVTGVSATTTAAGLGEFQVFCNTTRLQPITSSYTASASDGATITSALGIINTSSFGSLVPFPTGTGTSTGSTGTRRFPVAAVAGGVAAGMVVLIIVIATLCIRRRRSRNAFIPLAFVQERQKHDENQPHLIFTPYIHTENPAPLRGQAIYSDTGHKRDSAREPFLPSQPSWPNSPEWSQSGTSLATSSRPISSAGGSSLSAGRRHSAWLASTSSAPPEAIPLVYFQEPIPMSAGSVGSHEAPPPRYDE